MKRKTNGRSARGATATKGKGTRGGGEKSAAEGTPKMIDFKTFAEVVDVLARMVGRPGVQSADAAELANFVYNEGTAEDHAELLLVVAPIAQRVVERKDARKD